MKYLQITPATPDKMGECVLPTMEKPDKNNFKVNTESNWAAWTTAVDQWRKHLDSLPKLPTTCTLPAGEWFEGETGGYQYTNGIGIWVDCDLEFYNNVRPHLRREVIVPVEQKDEPKGKGKRITLCGSTKFKREFDAINKQLTLEGNVVYSVCAFGHADKIEWTKEQKELLDEVHKRKIDNSDAIFVIDVDGYIGDSTRSEIEYAAHHNKTIRFLSDFPDLKMICDYATLSLAPKVEPQPAPKESAREVVQKWIRKKGYTVEFGGRITNPFNANDIVDLLEEFSNRKNS